MKKTKYFLALSGLVAICWLAIQPNPWVKAETPQVVSSTQEKAVYWNALAAISDYYTRVGNVRTPSALRPFLDSSHRVAAMIPGFPTNDRLESAHLLFSYGGQESVYRKSFVNINFPGQRFSNGTSVKRFSVDWGWVGLNDRNVSLTYVAARALQEGEPFPDWVSVSLHPDARKFLRENLKIPKDLHLLWIRPGMAKEAREQWKWAQSQKMSWDDFRERYNHGFREKTDDDLDSLLIYRVIVEVDRKARGWEYQTWSKDVSSTLRRVRREHKE